MAIQRKGSRTIMVDNQPYFWRIRHKPTYSQGIAETGLVVAIAHQGGGRRLTVELAAARPDNWLNKPAIVVTPTDIARFIRLAIKRGWVPTEDGSTFVLQGDDVNPEKSNLDMEMEWKWKIWRWTRARQAAGQEIKVKVSI